MGWADNYIKQLQEGEAVTFRPRGNSMTGRIESGNLVTIEPLDDYEIKRGDIVLCKVKGRQYLHIVKAIKKGQFLIGNNKGRTNGWTKADNIFGVCVYIEK